MRANRYYTKSLKRFAEVKITFRVTGEDVINVIRTMLDEDKKVNRKSVTEHLRFIVYDRGNSWFEMADEDWDKRWLENKEELQAQSEALARKYFSDFFVGN